MRGKIVFFTYSIVPRVDKRIKEFIEEGYEVEVFSFSNESVIDVDSNYKVNVLFSNPKISYLQRLIKYTPKIVDVINKYDREKVLFYFFSLNVSIPALICRNLNYIYEESDMLFDRSNIKAIRWLLKVMNKRIIKKSKQTVFTSEGFGKYYYGKNIPNNISLIPNKVSSECLNLPDVEKEQIDFNKLKFGFVGYIRYITLYNFAKVLIKNFPNYEFHFYGKNGSYTDEQINELESIGNVFFHGQFKNPNDLPLIYSKLDFIVATYDVRGVNPRFAEPNKIYEAMFFETPIIVSSNSFLANKVETLQIGFSVDPLDESDIIDKIKAITKDTYNSYLSRLRLIPKSESINNNKIFFDIISKL